MSPTKSPLLYFLFLVLLIGANGFAQTIRISEVISDNDKSLMDEDGNNSDWIELYNTSETAVDLDGWYLTDDSANLTKWRFPVTSIQPNRFLIVFASDEDRSVAGQELHTNFKLSASGEFIGLVQSDGSTIEDSYTLPVQEEDVSYGYGFSSSNAEPVVLIGPSASCSAYIPTSTQDAAGWQEADFDDSSWSSGHTGVGYETNSGYQNLIGLDVLAMRGVNQSVYIRVPFEVDDPSIIGALTLKMKYDDGFVAYINDVEVTASASAPDAPEWNSGSSLNGDEIAVTFEAFELDGHTSILQSGTNVLAIHGMNAGVNSSDLLFLPQLEAELLDGDIDTSEVGFLSLSTPARANGTIVYANLVETPVTTPERGFYDASFQATVTNVTPGATIRYTLDGSAPNASSTAYTGPVTISSTTNLRVRAFIDGWKSSPSRTDTYIFLDQVVTRSYESYTINGQALEFGMDSEVVSEATHQSVRDALKAIPSISISTDDGNLYDPNYGIYVNASETLEVPASAELLNPDGSEGFQMNAGLRIRGGASRSANNPKHSFRLFFDDDYGQSKLKYALFGDEGADEFKKIDLRTAQNYSWSSGNDSRNNFLRDVFARDSARDMGDVYTRSRYYHLYVNAEYWGLFMTEERPVDDFAESYLGGDSDDYDVVKVIGSRDPGAYSVEATDGTLDAYNRLYTAAMAGFTDNADYFSIMGLDANGEPDATKEKLLDVESMIDYLLVIYYTAASDNGITYFVGRYQKLNNFYAIYNRVNPDGFKWIQHDSEHSLDTYRAENFTGPFTHSNFGLPEYFNAQTLHEHLSENKEYQLKFADQVYKHFYNDGVFVRANCLARLNARAAEIDSAIVANAARWGSTSLDRGTWLSAVAKTRAFFSRSGDRVTEVIGYLEEDGLLPSIGPPLISRPGGLVDAGSTVRFRASDSVYYTIDGTDPRVIGGGISGSLYSSSIVINKPTHIKARSRSSAGEWSALTEATFWTAQVPLAVTELMYHSPDGNSGDFIEIQNISSEAVELAGYKIDDAVTLKFKNATQTSLGAGEYLVAVDDIDVFNRTYPEHEAAIITEFSGDLSNSGEEVDLEFQNNDLITFSYSDDRNWAQAADGAGHSLVPLDSAMNKQEQGSLDYGSNWRASAYMGGSPGAADTPPYGTVVLNEISAHTDTDLDPPYDSNDTIELYNSSDSTVTIRGWYLSDSLDDLTKWLIPDTTLSAHSFVVFDERDFHPDSVTGFGLNKAGEQVVLSTAGRIIDVVRFKGQENTDTNVSWGRYPDGVGDWLMTMPTDAAPNQPAAASLRISEIMYHPTQVGNDYEYIQIANVGSSSKRFDNETGTYRIDGGVEFDFPINTTLAAGERLWVLSFDPVDTVRLDQFCAAYGLIAVNETFLGGYKGELSDRGERVALERPQDSDDPFNPLDVSWVIVDEVYYFDQAPWSSEADGTGYPLIRSGLTSWIAPTATDTDGDLMEDSWELEHFDTITPSDPDWDGDGQSNFDEYIAGSDPANASSYFCIEGMSEGTLQWSPELGRLYNVYWTDDLSLPFIRIATGIPDTQSSFTDSESSNYTEGFYQLEVEME